MKLLQIGLLLLTINTLAQSSLENRFAVPQSDESTTVNLNTVYNYDEVDIYPYYPDGIKEFYKLFKQKLWVPSGIRKRAGYINMSITFVIEKNGSISNIKTSVFSMQPEDVKSLTTEIIKAMKKMPKWMPGKIKARPVRVKIEVPYILNVKVIEKEKKDFRTGRP
ncbi:MAG: hypothetical protein BM557_08725 [Flavobacterium sp. MedPE-SWcel]|uniref:energy transducer TonB n=1 Tax=uncultured Flavobacterium sp. TaxID=165435 RepID=UPI00090F57C0|nr:hypothetical protein [uncultured Flavobacterium sp.]OIQ17286.1 MAG: hypothetical protein BM557_08725 [Flavobacterium sp. MedPE-SWcel]